MLLVPDNCIVNSSPLNAKNDVSSRCWCTICARRHRPVPLNTPGSILQASAEYQPKCRRRGEAFRRAVPWIRKARMQQHSRTRSARFGRRGPGPGTAGESVDRGSQRSAGRATGQRAALRLGGRRVLSLGLHECRRRAVAGTAPHAGSRVRRGGVRSGHAPLAQSPAARDGTGVGPASSIGVHPADVFRHHDGKRAHRAPRRK